MVFTFQILNVCKNVIKLLLLFVIIIDKIINLSFILKFNNKYNTLIIFNLLKSTFIYPIIQDIIINFKFQYI